jgi:hypothetical protein
MLRLFMRATHSLTHLKWNAWFSEFDPSARFRTS